jgi:tRNA pseudouridine synthase 10
VKEELKIIETAELLLHKYAFCAHCLGRQFAMLGHGLTNKERGNAILLLLVMEGSKRISKGDDSGIALLRSIAQHGFSQLAIQTLQSAGIILEEKEINASCYLCGDVFKSLDALVLQIINKFSKFEVQSFLVGIKGSTQVEEKEDELRVSFKLKWGESIRNELSREIGKRIMQVTEKNVDYERPNILVLVDPFMNAMTYELNPLFISGRYRKLIRGIPQSRWLCRQCKGKGCSKCAGTGKMYSTSIEELISTQLLKNTKGQITKLHAAGREDIDAKVLGLGRPFVIEVKKPKIWKIDLKKLEEEINQGAAGKIEVHTLQWSSKEYVKKLKSSGQATKRYRVVVEFEQDVTDKLIYKIREGLIGKLIRQMTPSRVMHRRSLKLRKKEVYGIDFKRLQPNCIEMIIRCQGGLYIKELISGDAGRTTPSVSEICNFPAKCLEIDVIGVEEGRL